MGYKVFIRHERFYRTNVDNTMFGPYTRNKAEQIGFVHSTVLPRGGITTVDIFHGNQLIGHGVAACSLQDGFCRKTGRELALERALENKMRDYVVKWSEILEEVSVDTLEAFCEGTISRRTMESQSAHMRKALRTLGADTVRERARDALRRRNSLST